MNVMVTGTGRSCALGYNMALRYLENGDTVVATARKESEALNELKEKYGDKLIILLMDIGDSASVNKAALNMATMNLVNTFKDDEQIYNQYGRGVSFLG